MTSGSSSSVVYYPLCVSKHPASHDAVERTERDRERERERVVRYSIARFALCIPALLCTRFDLVDRKSPATAKYAYVCHTYTRNTHACTHNAVYLYQKIKEESLAERPNTSRSQQKCRFQSLLPPHPTHLPVRSPAKMDAGTHFCITGININRLPDTGPAGPARIKNNVSREGDSASLGSPELSMKIPTRGGWTGAERSGASLDLCR